jgi:hypothetical protein
VGQTEYVIPADYKEIYLVVESCDFCGHWNLSMADVAREQRHDGPQTADRTCACSDGPRPSPYRIPARTDGPSLGSGWFRVHQWLEGKFRTRHDISCWDCQPSSGFANNELPRSRSVSCKRTKLLHIHTDTDTIAHCARSCFFL